MNAGRRKTLRQAILLLEEAKTLVETVMDEEQAYFDNMPESLQSGDKGQKAEVAVEAMETTIASIDDTIDAINNACA